MNKIKKTPRLPALNDVQHFSVNFIQKLVLPPTVTIRQFQAMTSATVARDMKAIKNFAFANDYPIKMSA